ncbi:MAG: hypothetical protein ABMA26_20835 [Limisphaerales bacterium]
MKHPLTQLLARFTFTTLVSTALLASAADAPLKPDAKGFIRDWLLLAPIQLAGENTGAEEIDKPQVPFEAALQPKAGDAVTIAGKAIKWRAIKAKDYFFDVNELLGGMHENVTAYAVAYVVAAKDVTGAQLLMGSNDQGKVYLNGKEVVKFAETRTLDPDTDKATGLTLKAGVNVVVFKVINENNNWQGCLRFTDAAGKPLAGLTLKLAP